MSRLGAHWRLRHCVCRQICVGLNPKKSHPFKNGNLTAIYFQSSVFGVRDPRLLSFEMASTSRLVIDYPTCLSTDAKKKPVNQCGDRPTAVADSKLSTGYDVGFRVRYAGWTAYAGRHLGCFFVFGAPKFEPGEHGWAVSLRCVA